MSIGNIPTKPAFLSLQAGRAIAATMVVVLHVSFFAGTFVWQAAQLGVVFFFVLSGAVILLAHQRDIGRPSAVFSYLWKRFRRLYPVYWIVFVPFVLVRLAAHHQPADLTTVDAPWTMLSNFLLVHIHSTEVNFPVGWTLFHEVVFYLVFAVFLVHRWLGGAVFLVWLAVCAYLSPGGVWTAIVNPLNLIFPVGMGVGLLLSRCRVAFPKLLFVSGLLLFAWSFFRLNLLPHFDMRSCPNALPQMLAATFGSALAALGAAELERRGLLRIPAWLRLLGDASYSVYLVHYPLLRMLSTPTLKVWDNLHLPRFLWLVCMTTLLVLIGVGFHLIAERPLLHRLGGFRRPAPNLA